MMEKDYPEASLAYLWCIGNNWKLILCYDGQIEGWGLDTQEDMRKQPIRLYDIIQDPLENVNLADKYPGIVNQLHHKIESWFPLQKRKVFMNNQLYFQDI